GTGGRRDDRLDGPRRARSPGPCAQTAPRVARGGDLMPKLEEALVSFSKIEGPEIWPEVLERRPRPLPPGPSGPRRLAVALLAFAVAAAGLGLVIRGFEGRRPIGPAPSGTRSTPTPEISPTGTPTDSMSPTT